MEWFAVAAGAVLILGVFTWPRWRRWWRARARRRRLRRLRAEYLRMLNQPERHAKDTLHRELEGLAEQQPGRSPEWYLEKLIHDLERARR